MKAYGVYLQHELKRIYLDQQKARKSVSDEAFKRYTDGEFFMRINDDMYSWDTWSNQYFLEVREMEVIE
jgi:hypothetical protein